MNICVIVDTVPEVVRDWVFSDPLRTKDGSTVTYAHLVRPNGAEVIQRCVSPSVLSKDPRPFSQYMVACGIDYVDEVDPDLVSRAKAMKDILEMDPGIDQAALKAGKPHLYECWLYWEFADLDIEHAIAFADSLAVRVEPLDQALLQSSQNNEESSS